MMDKSLPTPAVVVGVALAATQWRQMCAARSIAGGYSILLARSVSDYSMVYVEINHRGVFNFAGLLCNHSMMLYMMLQDPGPEREWQDL